MEIPFELCVHTHAHTYTLCVCVCVCVYVCVCVEYFIIVLSPARLGIQHFSRGTRMDPVREVKPHLPEKEVGAAKSGCP